MSNFVKNLYPKCFCRISVIMGKGYCLRWITLFNCQRLLIQHTLLSFLGITKEGLAHSLSCWGTRTPRHKLTFEHGQMYLRHRIWSVLHWVHFQCELFMGVDTKSAIKEFLVKLEYISHFWCAVRWCWFSTTSQTSVHWYLASKISVAYSSSQYWPRSSSSCWMK